MKTVALILIFSTAFTFSDIKTIRENVSLRVSSINEIEISENQTNISISYQEATPGVDPIESEIESSNTYSFTTLDSKNKKKRNKRIVAKIDQELPDGKSLYMRMEAPEGARSTPPVVLDEKRFKTLVRKIPANTKADNLRIFFYFKSKTRSGPMKETPIQVTLKIVNDR